MVGAKRNAIAIDESKSSEEAFQWYMENFHREGDTVVLLHVHLVPRLPVMGLMGGSLATSDDYCKNIEDSSKDRTKLLNKFKHYCQQRSIKCKVVLEHNEHSPGENIIGSVKSHHADNVIIGQKAFGSYVSRLLDNTKNTSDYVLRHASVPVIVVPAVKSLKTLPKDLQKDDCQFTPCQHLE